MVGTGICFGGSLYMTPPGADLGEGSLPPLPTPNFETQIFGVAATPLRDVGKISLGPPHPTPYTNLGSAPGHYSCIQESLD